MLRDGREVALKVLRPEIREQVLSDLDAMEKAQRLRTRGILPGDMLWIYTGWSEHWKEGDDSSPYYAMAPGLASSCRRSISRDFEMSQFWQNLHARLQPAVPNDSTLVPGWK